MPVAFRSNSQCRGRIDGDRKAAMSGIVLMKFLMFFETSIYNPVFLTVFLSPDSFLSWACAERFSRIASEWPQKTTHVIVRWTRVT